MSIFSPRNAEEALESITIAQSAVTDAQAKLEECKAQLRQAQDTYRKFNPSVPATPQQPIADAAEQYRAEVQAEAREHNPRLKDEWLRSTYKSPWGGDPTAVIPANRAAH